MTYPTIPRAPRSSSPTPASRTASRSTSTRSSCTGFPEGKAAAEAIAGYWEKIGIKTEAHPRRLPGVPQELGRPARRRARIGYFNIANRNWIGAYALLEKMAYTPSKPNDTANDAEIDGMIAQVMKQTDQQKINALMRNIFTRLRSEHLGMPGRVPALARTRRRRRSASGTRAP